MATQRIPGDAFEVILFREHIHAALAWWSQEGSRRRTHVGVEPNEHGEYSFDTWMEPAVFSVRSHLTDMEPVAVGVVWLEHETHPDRVLVQYRLEPQEGLLTVDGDSTAPPIHRAWSLVESRS